MSETKNKRVVVWLLLLIVGLGGMITTKESIASQNDTKTSPVLNDMIDVPEIVISNDTEVAYWANGGGDGSPGNPYILENYNILGMGPFGILVDASGTGMPYNVSFIIRNCIVTAIEVCIKIVDAYPNLVRIESCYCYGTIAGDGIGIHLLRCDGAVIWNCTCNYNLHTGIRIDTCAGVLVEENTCYNNGDEGIYIDNASDGGIYKSNDVILNGGFGIINEISHSNNFLYNTIINNSWEGIVISNSQQAIIENNTVETNGFAYAGYGIYYINSDYGQVIFNNIKGHQNYGLVIDLISDNLIVHHNNFIQNNQGLIQAEEDATYSKINATWYDAAIQEGNYWDDYIGPGFYYIDGTAANYDPYPLNSPVTITGIIPEYPLNLIGLILTLSVFGLVAIFYKKK